MRFVLPALALVVVTAAAPAADTRKIDEAIKRGTNYLRGSFDPGKKNTGGTHKVGTLALCGLAMLETGVKADEPSMRYITDVLRAEALAQTETYQVSLCVLFLDRLGDPADVPVIQMLGVRLYAGLGPTGAFSYRVWDAVDAGEISRLQSALQKRELLGGDKKPDKKEPKDDGFLKPTEPVDKGPKTKLHPEVTRTLGQVRDIIQARGRGGFGGGGTTLAGDNSNTQFGLIGLWVAGRHGVPVKDALALIEARFMNTQNPRDGGWGYQDGQNNSTLAMTCAGLLGLAIGGAARDSVTPRTADKKGGDKGEGADDPFFNPKKGDGEKAEPGVKARPNSARDRAAEAALKAVGSVLGTKTGSGLANFVGLGNILYSLWSVERMAVAYQLETVGGIDWYDLGSTHILSMQSPNGAFFDAMYTEDINTALALLFLVKANFTKDLGARKTKDPGKVELRGGGAQNPLTAPPTVDKDRAKRGAGGGTAAGGVNDTPAPPKGGTGLPEVEQPTEATEADKVAKGLTAAANEADFTKALAEARDTKGAKWTKGLVLAAARLDGEKRRLAREALAERLCRMTPPTLQEMLRDKEAELRRAAALACGMRDEKAFIPDLIERITDPSDVVVRAVRASLVSLSGADFGPKQTDEDSKLKAAAGWTKWYDGQTKK
jgi:hypothetical protein